MAAAQLPIVEIQYLYCMSWSSSLNLQLLLFSLYIIPLYALHYVDFLLHRFLTAPLWKCLLTACSLLPISAPSQDPAEDATIPVPDVPCSDLSSSLQDIISQFVEAPRLRPLLLVHNGKSFLSMLNRSVVVEEFKRACKVCAVR